MVKKGAIRQKVSLQVVWEDNCTVEEKGVKEEGGPSLVCKPKEGHHDEEKVP